MLVVDDESGMRAALREARESLARDEVPVGCVIVHDGVVIGRGYNQVERLQDATAHAEILAIGAASNALGRWRLSECTLYVTLEPCSMCAGAIVLARLERVVFGAWDDKAGMAGSVEDLLRHPRLNHRPQVRGAVLAQLCGDELSTFFAGRRRP